MHHALSPAAHFPAIDGAISPEEDGLRYFRRLHCASGSDEYIGFHADCRCKTPCDDYRHAPGTALPQSMANMIR